MLVNGVNYKVKGRALHHCYHGQGVSYQEAYASLQRLSGSKWKQLDITKAKKYGAGQIETPYAEYDCFHLNNRLYRIEATAYSVINRVVYFGGPIRRTEGYTCPG